MNISSSWTLLDKNGREDLFVNGILKPVWHSLQSLNKISSLLLSVSINPKESPLS